MSDKLFSKKKKDYGSQYDEHFFEQYKLYLQSAEKISDRRQQANNYFITINAALITFLGLSFRFNDLESLVYVHLLFCLVGVVICVIFGYLIRSYKQLNTGKFQVIQEIERRLPITMYEREWQLLGEGKDRKKYTPFSDVEILVPWAFGVIYMLTVLFLTWMKFGYLGFLA